MISKSLAFRATCGYGGVKNEAATQFPSDRVTYALRAAGDPLGFHTGRGNRSDNQAGSHVRETRLKSVWRWARDAAQWYGWCCAAFCYWRLVKSFLFGTQPNDPGTLALAGVVLAKRRDSRGVCAGMAGVANRSRRGSAERIG